MELPQSIRVSEYLGLVNFALREVIHEGIYIEGEVAQYKVSQGKWVYFDLKDEESGELLPCFSTMFTPGMNVIADGMRIRVRGYAKIYEKNGRFSLTVQEAIPSGEGALRKAFEQLRDRLEREGLFSADRKRAIPRFPERIGLITSKDAAAYGDFLRVLNNRWGGVKIIHAHAQVQGAQAVQTICAALEAFQRMPSAQAPEVLVVTRGGGSTEELQAFNDERVVRAIYASRIPVVVGVGHERDETLADYVADVRASTPSNAAERVVPKREEVARDLSQTIAFMESYLSHGVEIALQKVTQHTRQSELSVERMLARAQTALERFMYGADKYRSRVALMRESLARYMIELEHALHTHLQKTRSIIGEYEAYLRGLDPKRVLARGYAIVRSKERVVRNAKEMREGDVVTIEVAHGEIGAQIIKKYQQSTLL
jgi:exodeoxyribonuclease VII large subunit